MLTRSLTRTICFVTLMAPNAIVYAQGPTSGPYSYHEMRTVSGLAGGTYGADSEGNVSFSGPIAFSTPVANTLGHNHVWIGASQYSYKSYPVLNTRDSNSGYIATYGTTLGRVNIATTANFIDTHFSTLFNIQAQLIPRQSEKFSYSVGVADLFDHTKSYDSQGRRVPSLSTFAVTTYRAHLGRYAASLSAGTGSRRFAPFFGSATLQVARPLRVWLEEDRYGNVSGLTYAGQLGRGTRPVPFTASLGAAKGKYVVAQAGIGF